VFQTAPVEFDKFWSDDLPCLSRREGEGSMSYEIIGIPGSRQFKHHSVLSIAALNVAAPSELSDTKNVSETVGKRPSARAPDNPSSTR
jgi:hypothetical protein